MLLTIVIQERQIRRSLHLTKLQQHRMQVIHEIYSTEETYVRDLQLMADVCSCIAVRLRV